MIEDRREHFLASSSGTDRIAYRELAARADGTILAMRFRWLDNVGGYVRSPEPGCSFRPSGNFVGPYRFQHLEVDTSDDRAVQVALKRSGAPGTCSPGDGGRR